MISLYDCVSRGWQRMIWPWMVRLYKDRHLFALDCNNFFSPLHLPSPAFLLFIVSRVEEKTSYWIQRICCLILFWVWIFKTIFCFGVSEKEEWKVRYGLNNDHIFSDGLRFWEYKNVCGSVYAHKIVHLSTLCMGTGLSAGLLLNMCSGVWDLAGMKVEADFNPTENIFLKEQFKIRLLETS